MANPQMGRLCKGASPIWNNRYIKNLKIYRFKNLDPWITAPVFMGRGLVDETCPPRINFAAYNNLKVEKKYVVFHNAGHGLPSEFTELRNQFIREKLGIARDN